MKVFLDEGLKLSFYGACIRGGIFENLFLTIVCVRKVGLCVFILKYVL